MLQGLLARFELSEAQHVPNGDEHVNPDLPVLDGAPEVLNTKLIGKRASVFFQATRNLLLLGLGQKLGSRRVIVHVKECDDGNDESNKTLCKNS